VRKKARPSVCLPGTISGWTTCCPTRCDLRCHHLENYAITDKVLAAANRLKPIGIPALNSLYETMSKNDELLREMKVCADNGEVMPNIPETGRFWGAMGSALQIATNGEASAQSASTEARENMLPSRK